MCVTLENGSLFSVEDLLLPATFVLVCEENVNHPKQTDTAVNSVKVLTTGKPVTEKYEYRYYN